MHRLIMPRVFELVDLVNDRSAEFAYFQNFESSIYEYPEKKRSWLLREKSFQRLDSNAWEFLKAEAKPYLINNSFNTRGHQQLFDILNQAFAFEYLQDQGFLDIEFIQRAKKEGIETPDLKASTLNGAVLCEVKSINLSADEVNRRVDGGVGFSRVHLDQGFFNKLDSDIKKAEKQMVAYDQSNKMTHIVFIIPDFDDSLSEYKVEYYEQIDHYLSKLSLEVSIVFYNMHNVFQQVIHMRNAEVVNQG